MPDTPKPENLGRMIENAKKELERMIDLHPMGMFLATPQGHIQRANKKLLRLLSLKSFSQMLGKRFGELLPPENLPDQIQKLNRLFGPTKGQGDLHASLRASLILPDHHARELLFTVVSSGPEAAFFVVVVRDISDERAEVAAREKQCRMEAAEAVVGALMHNINQPLTVIMIRAQLLLMSLNKATPDKTELSKGLEEIVQLTSQVAGTLQQSQIFNDFVMEPYTENAEIVDLKRSTT